jgi:hypothetical protein
MTISELISNLEALRNIHGEIKVESFSFVKYEDSIEFGGFEVEPERFTNELILVPSSDWK